MAENEDYEVHNLGNDGETTDDIEAQKGTEIMGGRQKFSPKLRWSGT